MFQSEEQQSTENPLSICRDSVRLLAIVLLLAYVLPRFA